MKGAPFPFAGTANFVSYRRTKIVCTIGPTSASPGVLRKLIHRGMDVARLNFSHGSREERRLLTETIRRIFQEEGKEIVILQDLTGPKIRVGLPGSTNLLRATIVK